MKLATAIVASIVALAPGAYASTNGTLGATSTGSFAASVTITQSITGSQVQVSGLSDISLGSFPNNYNTVIQKAADFCIYHTSPTFSATISRLNNLDAGPGVYLFNSNGDKIPALAQISANSGYSNIGEPSNNLFVEGKKYTGLTGNNVSQNCSTGPIAIVSIRINNGINQNDGALNVITTSTPTGTYTSTFQIVIAAE